VERRATTNGSISKPSTKHAMAPCWSWTLSALSAGDGELVRATFEPGVKILMKIFQLQQGANLWLAESSLIEYLQEIFAGGEESHDEWQHQQALNCQPKVILFTLEADDRIFTLFITLGDIDKYLLISGMAEEENDLWLAESSLIEYLQEIFAGGEESHDEWQHQQAISDDSASQRSFSLPSKRTTGYSPCSSRSVT
jgi:hypothetical protein